MSATGPKNSPSTHESLLTPHHWDRFDRVYRPFVAKWLRYLQKGNGLRLQPEDIEQTLLIGKERLQRLRALQSRFERLLDQ